MTDSPLPLRPLLAACLLFALGQNSTFAATPCAALAPSDQAVCTGQWAATFERWQAEDLVGPPPRAYRSWSAFRRALDQDPSRARRAARRWLPTVDWQLEPTVSWLTGITASLDVGPTDATEQHALRAVLDLLPTADLWPTLAPQALALGSASLRYEVIQRSLTDHLDEAGPAAIDEVRRCAAVDDPEEHCGLDYEQRLPWHVVGDAILQAPTDAERAALLRTVAPHADLSAPSPQVLGQLGSRATAAWLTLLPDNWDDAWEPLVRHRWAQWKAQPVCAGQAQDFRWPTAAAQRTVLQDWLAHDPEWSLWVEDVARCAPSDASAWALGVLSGLSVALPADWEQRWAEAPASLQRRAWNRILAHDTAVAHAAARHRLGTVPDNGLCAQLQPFPRAIASDRAALDLLEHRLVASLAAYPRPPDATPVSERLGDPETSGTATERRIECALVRTVEWAVGWRPYERSPNDFQWHPHRLLATLRMPQTGPLLRAIPVLHACALGQMSAPDAQAQLHRMGWTAAQASEAVRPSCGWATRSNRIGQAVVE